MAEKILMIALSPTMEQGTIITWNKKVGDTISSGDIICEVETDKASMEYESIQEGTLLKILVDEGGQAVVGRTIAVIGKKDEDISGLLEQIASEEKEKPGTDTPEEKTKQEKNAAEEDEKPKTSSGGDKKADEPDKPQASQKDVPPPPSDSRPEDPEERVYASPLAREMARQAGLDIVKIPGSGPRGRVVQRDVKEALKRPGEYSQALVAGAHASAVSGQTEEDRRIPISGIRRTIAQRLAASKFSAPHFYLKVNVRGEGLVRARRSLNETLKDTKVSVNAFLIKFAAEALARHRNINAGWTDEAIIEFSSIDIGLAVSVPGGLITPIVRNCGVKGVKAIDDELSALIEKAKNGSLKPGDYSGATFTISNLGSFGIDEFTAIINPPGSAILAVGALKAEPAAAPDGSVQVVQQMALTLSCDHRVIDGAAGAEFLNTLKRFMEDPVQILF
ncbi:MAG: pyruvate dehydrogenase complex dihydrolipoamide acetyltransferase [Spirochaetales bacterium]|nr:pyruvate dehydrogenase complex dihydrolipoamide acetyltransferase [Spirochaetales bacterium]